MDGWREGGSNWEREIVVDCMGKMGMEEKL